MAVYSAETFFAAKVSLGSSKTMTHRTWPGFFDILLFTSVETLRNDVQRLN